MEADKHRDQGELIDVRLLDLTERLEATWLGATAPPRLIRAGLFTAHADSGRA